MRLITKIHTEYLWKESARERILKRATSEEEANSFRALAHIFSLGSPFSTREESFSGAARYVSAIFWPINATIYG